MPLLEGVRFHVPPSVSAERQLHVSTLLQANGASLAPLTEADYVVTNAFDFEGWQSVPDNAKVVTVRTLLLTGLAGRPDRTLGDMARENHDIRKDTTVSRTVSDEVRLCTLHLGRSTILRTQRCYSRA